MMKNEIIVILFFVFIFQSSNAQIDWGIKGGLNFASASDIQINANEISPDANSETGYHAGVFLKFKATRFYIRPELVYTVTKSSYDLSTFQQGKIDLPVLLGFTLIKPISLFAGPSLQYIVDSDFDLLSLGDFEKELTAGFNIGVGAEIGFFGIDARYERSFSNNVADFSNFNGSLSTNSEQFIVSAFVKF